MASSDYTDERKALRAKTAQLKALRLAQEAKVSAEQEAKPSASGPAARKVVKKKKASARTPELVESDISRAEQRLNEISEQMGTPEVARDPDRLFALNDEYQQTETLLRTLYEEWDRVTQETAPAPS